MPYALAAIHARMLDAGDHVRVRDDDAGTRDPARSLDPEPARRPRDSQDAVESVDDVRVAGEPGVRGRDGCGRADEHTQRIHALERREEPVGRERLVDPREDRGPLYGLAELRLARQVEQHGSHRPAEDDAGKGAQGEPGARVERTEPRDRAHRPPERDAEHLCEAREQRASEERAA